MDMYARKIEADDVYQVKIWGDNIGEKHEGSWYEMKAKILSYGNFEEFELDGCNVSEIYLPNKELIFAVRKYRKAGAGHVVALYDRDLYCAWNYDEYNPDL
jgi:hypothetical protein